MLRPYVSSFGQWHFGATYVSYSDFGSGARDGFVQSHNSFPFSSSDLKRQKLSMAIQEHLIHHILYENYASKYSFHHIGLHPNYGAVRGFTCTISIQTGLVFSHSSSISTCKSSCTSPKDHSSPSGCHPFDGFSTNENDGNPVIWPDGVDGVITFKYTLTKHVFPSLKMAQESSNCWPEKQHGGRETLW